MTLEQLRKKRDELDKIIKKLFKLGYGNNALDLIEEQEKITKEINNKILED